MKNVKTFLIKYKLELIIFLSSLIFSAFLMFSTFSYQDGYMQISTKAWSDFASHIPLIRSFSLGANFPPQYPLFSGPPIKYHFLFYMFVGFLEKSGLRIDYALNLPSIFGFSFLLLMIYAFAKNLFKSSTVGILSILFFLFNSSLDFVNFFIKHPLSIVSLRDIFSNTNFTSFGPYDGKIISAFWNLNIYTNQRHLALSYALSLLLIYLVLNLKDKKIKSNFKILIFMGVVLGLSFLLNMAVFLMTILILICIFLLFTKKRLPILILLAITGLIAAPQYIFTQSGDASFKPIIHFGYLITNFDFFSFINYWWQNLGLCLIFIPLGFIIAGKNEKKIFLIFLSLFIVGNVIQFSPEIAANHKFFNYFMIVGNMFTAFLIVKAWKKHLYLKIIFITAIIALILSGIIDFFPIFNDKKIALADYPINKNIVWITTNTSSKANFLNTNYLYDTASIAGRKIFLGWPYFAWSQGYDTLTRDNLRKSLLNTNNFSYFCDNITKNQLNYAEVDLRSQDAIVNLRFFEDKFTKVYKNENYIIYSLKNCK
jgi:hypothetical protein